MAGYGNSWQDSWKSGALNLDYLNPDVGGFKFDTGPAIEAGSYPMSTGVASGGGGLFGNTPFLSNQNQQGWGGMALGAAQGLASAYMGMKQYGLAKDSLKQSKDVFNKNFDAQRRTTNASLEDRQRARIASNSGAYESVGSYMNKNGIR